MTRALIYILILLLTTSVFSETQATDSNETLYLIANVPDGRALDASYALSLYRGERKNWDGGKSAIVVLPGRLAASHKIVAESVFEMSSQTMMRHWFRLVFSGRVIAPRYMDSDPAIVEFVKQRVGAVAVTLADKEALKDIQAVRLDP
jgi:hypothetical protein